MRHPRGYLSMLRRNYGLDGRTNAPMATGEFETEMPGTGMRLR